MKNFKSTIGILLLSVIVFAGQATNKDTVIIELGIKGKMLIIAPTVKDFKDLEQYDINQMLADLNTTLDTTSASVDEFTMTSQMEEKSEDSLSTDQKKSDSDSYNIRYYDGSTSSNSGDGHSENNIFNSKTRSRRNTNDNFQFEFGLSNWLEKGTFPDAQGQPYAIKPWGSWYFALGFNNQTHIGGPLLINWGGNVSWNDWKMQNANVRINEENGKTNFVEDDTYKGVKSKLTAIYLNVSAVPMLDFGYSKKSGDYKGTFGNKSDGFRIGAGGYAGYRVGSHTKFVYDIEGNKNRDKTKDDYFLNSFRYGVRGEVGYKGLDFFFNYDLNNVFATSKGPSLNAISFGIIL